ncbi:antibiotic biosynthesis monooxygenase [Aquibacillus halophilus]|uniref:Antibiotic biosynthesis monooxygenase n=1 Tax=Aquibacillus halophilus TaxID=930132 RepID=A0A6A8DI11_9BACI|nr:antibiotic biosynthesis monooxygenase [Aquibacillus halophilus]MRH44146.1 antibiotic biosynthesis monooxygenase [Aquibacillus halophilus]
MKAFMTNGTLDYLTRIDKQHPNLSLFLMYDQDNTLAYYEDEGPTIFDTPREFEIIVSKGELKNDGFVVMNNIPVTDEGKPIFESQFKQRAGMIEDTPGFYALRVLRPTRGNKYVVMVQWKDSQSYQEWKNSEAFSKSHSKTTKAKEKPSYSAGPSYAINYHMVEDDEEDQF